MIVRQRQVDRLIQGDQRWTLTRERAGEQKNQTTQRLPGRSSRIAVDAYDSKSKAQSLEAKARVEGTALLTPCIRAPLYRSHPRVARVSPDRHNALCAENTL